MSACTWIEEVDDYDWNYTLHGFNLLSIFLSWGYGNWTRLTAQPVFLKSMGWKYLGGKIWPVKKSVKRGKRTHDLQSVLLFFCEST